MKNLAENYQVLCSRDLCSHPLFGYLRADHATEYPGKVDLPEPSTAPRSIDIVGRHFKPI